MGVGGWGAVLVQGCISLAQSCVQGREGGCGVGISPSHFCVRPKHGGGEGSELPEGVRGRGLL